VCRRSERPELHQRRGIYHGEAAHRRRLLGEISARQKLGARLPSSRSSLGLRRNYCRAQRSRECGGATARWRRRGAGAAEPTDSGARASVAAAVARVGAEGVGDPICRAVGHPWHAGRVREPHRKSRVAGARRGRRKEGEERGGANGWGQSQKEREGGTARAGQWQNGSGRCGAADVAS
jgi:hypothetical protein